MRYAIGGRSGRGILSELPGGMMATIQGQGIRTQEKEDAFQGLFRMNLKVHSSLRYPLAKYHHFDLNAGSGRNDIAGCDGSPVVFLKVVSGLGVSNFAA